MHMVGLQTHNGPFSQWGSISTRTLKPDSLNPRFIFNVILRTIHTVRILSALHCWTGSHTLSHSTEARSLNTDWGHVEAKWSLDPNPQSASDPDSRSRLERPYVPSLTIPRSTSASVLQVVFSCWHLKVCLTPVLPNLHLWSYFKTFLKYCIMGSMENCLYYVKAPMIGPNFGWK